MSTLTEKAVELLAYLDRTERVQQRSNERPTIAELLSQSRSQHLIYRRSLRHRANGITVDGNPVAAAEALAASARLRAQAEVRDPQHADSAWADDLAAKFPHTAMVEFYGDEVRRLMPQVFAEPEPAPVDVNPKEAYADETKNA